MKHSIVFFFLLCLLSPLFSDAFLNLPSNSRFPSVEAEKLIRELNLFPEKSINIADHDPLGSSLSDDDAKIVERPLKLSNLIDDSTVSVQDLGHHAGYYKIQHSHAARLIFRLLFFPLFSPPFNYFCLKGVSFSLFIEGFLIFFKIFYPVWGSVPSNCNIICRRWRMLFICLV